MASKYGVNGTKVPYSVVIRELKHRESSVYDDYSLRIYSENHYVYNEMSPRGLGLCTLQKSKYLLDQ